MDKIKISEISLKHLHVSKFNVRRSDPKNDIIELTENIKLHKITNPLTVNKISNRKYEIISGQRRFIAAKNAGLKTVPCIIKSYENSIQKVMESFSENIFRSDMTLTDKSRATQQLMAHFKNDKTLVANSLGVRKATVDRYLEVEAFPSLLKNLISKRQINFATAKTIYKMTSHDPKHMQDLIDAYIHKKLNQKADFYTVIKNSKGTESVEQLEKEFKKIRNTDKFKIRLPNRDSQYIQNIALAKKIPVEMVIAEIISVGIAVHKTGRVKL